MSDKTYKRVPLEKLKTFKGRCEHLYVIQPKSGKNKTFDFLQAQTEFNKIVEEEFERTKKELDASKCKIIALKPRQVGWTTYSNIKSLDMQIQHEGSNGVIVAHDSDTTEKIYGIYQRAYDNLPDIVIPTKDGKDMSVGEFIIETKGEDAFYKKLKSDDNFTERDATQTMKIPYKPDETSYSGKRIGFKDTDSMTTIFTAGKGDAGGLGGTVRRVHMSECANYPRYKDLMTSLKPSIPKFDDNVFFIMESTANGTTGDGEGFYKAWERSVKEWEKYKKGETQRFTGMRPVFIPWYMIDEYELPLAGGKLEDISEVDFGEEKVKQEFLEREQRLMDEGIYNPLTEERQVLTPEKINWYRFIIKDDCEFDYREAQRFYPTTPEEAFVASTNCFFNATRLNEVKKKYVNEGEPDHKIGNLVFKEDGEVGFEEDTLGNFKIWKEPDPKWDNRYVVSGDIARGHEDGDYSVSFVFDRLNQEYVAKWHGKIDQDKFAEILSRIGYYYNEALLVPESNLDTVVELIKPDGHVAYNGEIYFNDKGSGMKWGYWTDGGSRNILINSHKAWLRDNEDGYWALKDEATVNEHLSFVRHQTRNGVKYEAAEGEHDDSVISSALCIVGDNWWEMAPQKYEPNKVMQVLKKVTNTKSFKQSSLGRR